MITDQRIFLIIILIFASLYLCGSHYYCYKENYTNMSGGANILEIDDGISIPLNIQQAIRDNQPISSQIIPGSKGHMCYCIDPTKKCDNNGSDCVDFDQLLGDKPNLDAIATDTIAKFFCGYLKKYAYDLSKLGIELRADQPSKFAKDYDKFRYVNFGGKPINRAGSMFVKNCGTTPYRARYYPYQLSQQLNS